MKIQNSLDLGLIIDSPRNQLDAGLAAILHHLGIHDYMLRTQPLRSEIQFAHVRIPISVLLADKIRKLELRILLVHIIQSANIEALDNKPVTEILGHEQLDALVHKLVVLRPIDALSLPFFPNTRRKSADSVSLSIQ